MPKAAKPGPRWSLATSFWFCAVATAIVVPLVTLTVHKTIWVELEMVTGILAALMLLYFMVILHQGVRFTKERRALIDWPVERPLDVLDALGWTPDTGFFTSAGAEAGGLGIVVGFLLDVLVMLLLAVLITVLCWIGVNLVVAVLLFLFWVHARWLRYLVTTGRHCRGHWGRSLLHGAATTLRFTVWFYAAFFIAHKVGEIHAR